MTYASIQQCDNTEKPFVFTVNGVCDKGKAGSWSDPHHSGDGCGASITYTGEHGCVFLNGNDLLEAIEPFMGFIFVVIGGLMTFAGAKFLF